MWYDWLAVALVSAVVLTLALSYYCFRRVFYSKKRKPIPPGEYDILPGSAYEAEREQLVKWMDMADTLPHTDVEITSFDGLRLRGKYYECKKGAVTEILFHGYRGNARRDMSGGIERCFALGRNALIVDQRASGYSEGSVITFGINEHRDCLDWIKFATEFLGEGSKIIISGVSMGAGTVMTAVGEKMPPNVVAALADCGFTTARDIIKKVIREMHLPADILFPFVKLGGLIFGRFNIDANSPKSALSHATVPVIFIHGDIDGFVPCDMSRELYDICTSHKKLTVIEGADHGLAYPHNKEAYLAAVAQFGTECGV